MWRYIDVQADWRRSWTYGRAPNAIDISHMPVKAPTRDQPFCTAIPTYRPQLVAFYDHAGDTEDMHYLIVKRFEN